MGKMGFDIPLGFNGIKSLIGEEIAKIETKRVTKGSGKHLEINLFEWLVKIETTKGLKIEFTVIERF